MEQLYRHFESGDEKIPLPHSARETVDAVQQKMHGSSDLILSSHNVNGVTVGVMMFDGLVSNQQVSDFLLRPLAAVPPHISTGKELFDYLMETIYMSSECGTVETYDDLYIKTMSGFAAVIIDGLGKAITLGYQSFTCRSVDEPSAENNLRGSREGFCESLNPNLALVRRRLKSPALVAETIILGSISRTQCRLLYLDGVADETMLDTVRRRLGEVEADLVLDTGYLQPFLEGKRQSLFSGVGVTERPDTLCAKLCEGKAAVMMDGTPFVIFAPCLFIEHFHSLDDYTHRPYFATFIRVLKLFSFFLTVLLPGCYVAAISFHPELIPALLLGPFLASVTATPLPVLAEALAVFVVYELLREAGLRLPRPIGHALGIVSGVVIGDAGVEAGIIGLPMVIVIAFTAIASFVVPSLYEPVTVLRFAFILIGGLLGLLGVALAFALLAVNLCSLDSMGVPVSAPFSPLAGHSMRDAVLRAGWKELQKASFDVEGLSDEE